MFDFFNKLIIYTAVLSTVFRISYFLYENTVLYTEVIQNSVVNNFYSNLTPQQLYDIGHDWRNLPTNFEESTNILNILNSNQYRVINRAGVSYYIDLSRTNGFLRMYTHLSNANLPNRQLMVIVRDANDNYMFYRGFLPFGANRNRPVLTYIRILH